MFDGISTIELANDLTVSQALARFSDQTHLVVFHSGGRIRERDSRYSFLMSDPVAIERIAEATTATDPFQRFREWQSCLPAVESGILPPFCGGIAGLMSYELGAAFEQLPAAMNDSFRTPALWGGLFDWCIVWDHIASSVRVYVLTLQKNFDGINADLRHEARLRWVQERVSTNPMDFHAAEPQQMPADFHTVPVESAALHRILSGDVATEVRANFSRPDYLAAVDRVLQYIQAGHIFQANLSQQLTAPWHGTAIELFLRVMNVNPAPFCGLLRTPEFAIVSASPERFLKVTRGRFVETRPIKGTRRRQKSPIADLYTTEELTRSPKDRAENVMIVDLLRNDLSRSCRPGTVRVNGLCEVELFETVQHLVSTVVGELRPDKDIWDLVAGCFPGGSITGAPKIRAMQIITELEKTTRGAYCGSLFSVGPAQNFDSNILIRTFTLKNGMVRFPAGGGIVADSVAEEEYRETLHKASGMLRVLLPEQS